MEYNGREKVGLVVQTVVLWNANLESVEPRFLSRCRVTKYFVTVVWPCELRRGSCLGKLMIEFVGSSRSGASEFGLQSTVG